MANNIGGYRHPGDIEFRYALMVTSAGQVIDISPMIEELSVYQDIRRHYLECNFVMQDSLDLFDIIPPNKEDKIQGGFDGFEYFLVSFKNKTEDSKGETLENYNNHTFRIYSIDDRYKFGESKEALSISGISAEYFNSTVNKVSRSLGKNGGKTVSTMIKNITDEFLLNKKTVDAYRYIKDITKHRTEKVNEYDPTSGLHKFVIPNLTADDTIEFLINEADSPDHIPLYFFYEDAKGFKFKNVSNLIQAEPKGKWMYAPFNRKGAKPKDDEGAKTDDPFKIVTYTVRKQLNSMENITAGMFRQSTLHLDVLKKNYYTSEYDYKQSKGRFKKLQDSNFYGDAEGDPIFTMMTTRAGHEETGANQFAVERHLPKRVDQFQAVRTAYEKLIFNTVLDIQIPGTDNLNIGDVIEIVIPKTSGMLSDKESGGIDKYLSGKYLITKLRHKIQGAQTGKPYSTILEISKDTGII
jgi:hypothetical protein